MEPLFRSTPTSFFVILYNLNYNVPEKEVLIDPEKMLIDPKKALIDLENVSIHNAINKLNANQATKEKANLLFEKMGFDKIFGRKEIMENINISVALVKRKNVLRDTRCMIKMHIIMGKEIWRKRRTCWNSISPKIL